jgi:hypothetical protein
VKNGIIRIIKDSIEIHFESSPNNPINNPTIDKIMGRRRIKSSIAT